MKSSSCIKSLDVFSNFEIKLNHIITKYNKNPKFWITFITTRGPISCIDDSDNPPSKTCYEATNALLYTACISRWNCGSIDKAAHVRPNVFGDVVVGRTFRLHIVEHTDSPCLMSTKSSLQSLETHHTLSIRAQLKTLAWNAALIKAFPRWLKRPPMTRHLCFTVVRHTTVS